MILNAKVALEKLPVFRAELRENGFLFFPHVEEGFDHLGFVRQFGELRPQYDGRLVWSIKSASGFDDMYHSMNTKPLHPHTEYCEYEGLPNRYQALWCVVASECPGGQTLLADGYLFLDSLSADERNYMLSHSYFFGSSDGLKASGLGFTATHPMLEVTKEGVRIIRFSYKNMNYQGDPFIQDLVKRFMRFFERNKISISYSVNSLLLWDNFRFLHARTGFSDRRRELKRVLLDGAS